MPRTRSATSDRGSSKVIEAMETRQLLAGNVTAGIVGGVLVVQGDNKSNTIVIQSFSDVTTKVIPAPGTTVNGNGAATFVGWPAITVDLGNGDDSVTFVDLVFQSVNVTTGNGNDRVIGAIDGFPPNIFGHLTIDTGNGDDHVHLGGDTGVAADMNIDTGNGADVVEVVDNTGVGGNINIETGNGPDIVRLAGTFSIGGNLKVDGGRGPDVLDRGGAGFSIGGTVTFIDIETLL
jgi:hypothetical protein